MNLTPLEQTIQQIKKSSQILLCLSKHAKADSMLSAIATQKFLRSLSKEVTLICEELSWPEKLSFLPYPKFASSIKKKPLVISLDSSQVSPEGLSYKVQKNSLHIFIESDNNVLSAKDIHITETNPSYDLIITFGVTELGHLGNVFTRNSKLFYEIPIINIDSSPDNEGYGSIQFVDITHTSTSELVFSLLRSYDKSRIDPEIAMHLLTGIIVQTNCFRMTNISPKTLRAAAELIRLNADREKIISNLYRTRTLPVLKLWGRALSRLEHDQMNHIAWSRVHLEDFLQTNTSTEHLLDIVDEVIVNLPDIHVVVIFFEGKEKETRGFLFLTHPHITPSQLIRSTILSGNKRFAYFTSNHKNIPQAEREIIQEIRENFRMIQKET